MNNYDNKQEFNLNLPTDLKVQLEILAHESHLSMDTLILKVLSTYVDGEFNDNTPK